MRPDRLSTDVASSSWFRSYANDSHVSTAASSAPENAAGRLPDEPKFAGQKSIWRLRLACGLRRYFARAVAVFWVGLFFAWPQERDSSRRWPISEAPNPFFSNAITLRGDVRLIECGDDAPIRGHQIEFACALAFVDSMYDFPTISTWGVDKHALLLAIGGSPFYRDPSLIWAISHGVDPLLIIVMVKSQLFQKAPRSDLTINPIKIHVPR